MNQSEKLSRHLTWDACFNIRDLGGYSTKSKKETRWNTFVRSDSLHRLNPAGQRALIDYGVRTVINLRTIREAQQDPAAFVQQPGNLDIPQSLHIPIIDEQNARWRQSERELTSLADTYRLMLDLFGANFTAVIKAIAQADPGGVLFYCHAGKDRTGLVSALLLALVDVPDTTIAADYALTHQYLGPLYEEMRRNDAVDPAEFARLSWKLHSPAEAMMEALVYLNQEYGGTEAYLLSGGVKKEEIEQIRNRLLA